MLFYTGITRSADPILAIRRCYSGAVYVVTAPQAWYEWPYQIAYGWGSLFKALLVKRAC